jgi:putative ABC transport system permease protein
MFKNFINIALRNLSKNKLYTVINIFGLSIGLASALLIMLYVHHERTADRHHEHFDEIYRVGAEIAIGDNPMRLALSAAPMGQDLVDLFPEITDYVRLFPMGFTSDQVLIEYKQDLMYENGLFLVDSNFFDFFSHPAVYGTPEASIRHNNIAVLTKSTAERLFGPGNPTGKQFRLNRDHLIEVGAVIEDIPDNSHLKFRMLLFRNSLDNIREEYLSAEDYMQNNLYTYVRTNKRLEEQYFKNKVEQLVHDRIISQLMQFGIEGSYRLHFTPMSDIYFNKVDGYEPGNPEPTATKGDKTYVIIFIAIAVFLGFIASINYMNMAIARSVKRSKEVGVRKVMGAVRGNLIGQFLTESILVAMLAMIIALLWVEITLPLFNNLLSKNLSVLMLMQPQLLAMMAAIVLLTGFVSGSYPAFYLSGLRPIDVLKMQIRLSDRKISLRKVLVGLQFTISIGMIIATLVVAAQLRYMHNKETGYAMEDIIILNIRETAPDSRESLKEALKQLAFVKNATLSNSIPGPGNNISQWGLNFETNDGFKEHMINVYHVDHDYLDTYGIPLIEGRFFDPQAATYQEQAALVNEAAVKFFGWDDPIGKRVQTLGTEDQMNRRVVGIIKNFHLTSLQEAITPLLIMPQETSALLSISIHPGQTHQALQEIEKVWLEFSGGLPMRHQYMTERHHIAYANFDSLGKLFAAFAILCILLSLMGLFGLSGYTAEQKTREIGIRKVHGATLADILKLLYKEYAWLMLIAMLVASSVAWYFMNNWLAQFAYNTGLNVWPFFLASSLALLISVTTVGYHALRTSTANPVDSLKYE